MALQWSSAGITTQLKINWGAALLGKKPIDPYLVVADVTDFKWLAQEQPDKEKSKSDPTCVPSVPKFLPFLVETNFGANVFASNQSLDGIVIAPVYRTNLNGDKNSPLYSKFVTVNVAAVRVKALFESTDVKRIQLGMSRIGGIDPDNRLIQPLDFKNPKNLPSSFLENSGLSTLALKDDLPTISDSASQPLIDFLFRPLVGVIDDGCPFAHQTLKHKISGRSRLSWLWFQSQQHVPDAWKKNNQTPASTLHGKEFDALSLALPLNWNQSEDEFYKSIGYKLINNFSATHGNGVLQLLASNGAPALQPPDGSPESEPKSDAASQSDLVFVQLDKDSLDDTAGGSLCVHALDAVRYIIDKAVYKFTAPSQGSLAPIDIAINRRLVINLSYGTMGGAHDGKSPLEMALDELVGIRKNLAIVAAAGNSRRSQCHAQLDLRPKSCQSFIWQVSPDADVPSSLELWFQPKLGDDELANLTVKITTPDHQPVSLNCGDIKVLGEGASPQNMAATAVFTRNAVQSQDRAMLLLFCGKTILSDDNCGCAPYGQWRIEVTNGNSDKTVEANAYVERNDSAFAKVRRQQSFLLNDLVPVVTEVETGANPSSACKVFDVGAYWLAYPKAAPFSSLGPSEDSALFPEAYAPSGYGAATSRLNVAGLTYGTTSHIGGTSAAAAVFSRWLVNWLASQPPQPGLENFEFAYCDIKTELFSTAASRPIGETPPLPAPYIDSNLQPKNNHDPASLSAAGGNLCVR